MAGISTTMCTSFKKDVLEGIHNLQGTVVVVGTTVNASQTITTLASIVDLAPGMIASDVTNAGDIPASSYVSRLVSATSLKLDTLMAAGHVGDTLNFKGDSLAIALVKVGPTGTYDATTINYSDLTGNSDEVPNGSGYTTGGFVWAAGLMLTPASSGTGAYCQPSTNPSWTSATFSTIGAILYNISKLNKAISTQSFGGTQTVTAGTLTLLLPTNGVGTSLLQAN